MSRQEDRSRPFLLLLYSCHREVDVVATQSREKKKKVKEKKECLIRATAYFRGVIRPIFLIRLPPQLSKKNITIRPGYYIFGSARPRSARNFFFLSPKCRAWWRSTKALVVGKIRQGPDQSPGGRVRFLYLQYRHLASGFIFSQASVAN